MLIFCVDTQTQTNGCVLTAEQLVDPSTDAQDYLKDVDWTLKDLFDMRHCGHLESETRLGS